MSISFNVDEIFEMAEQIERNGARFYRKAAETFTGSNMRDTLLELADWERQHEETFAAMRKQLSAQQREPMVFDPENEAALYLRAMADGHVFDIKTDPAEQLTGQKTSEDILKTAICMEKDSIIYYLGLKDFVPVKTGKDKVEAIIKEEMSHIATLNQKLAALK